MRTQKKRLKILSALDISGIRLNKLIMPHCRVANLSFSVLPFLYSYQAVKKNNQNLLYSIPASYFEWIISMVFKHLFILLTISRYEIMNQARTIE